MIPIQKGTLIIVELYPTLVVKQLMVHLPWWILLWCNSQIHVCTANTTFLRVRIMYVWLAQGIICSMLVSFAVTCILKLKMPLLKLTENRYSYLFTCICICQSCLRKQIPISDSLYKPKVCLSLPHIGHVCIFNVVCVCVCVCLKHLQSGMFSMNINIQPRMILQLAVIKVPIYASLVTTDNQGLGLYRERLCLEVVNDKSAVAWIFNFLI